MSDISGEMDILRFLPHPRIVAIDNKPEELESITKGLFSLGLPCIPIPYDIMAGLETPSHWRPGRLRLIFLDLNLSDIEIPSTSPSMITGPIGDVLEALAPSGPYLIIFWTKHRRLVESTMKQLAERNLGSSLPLPFGFSTIDKAPFLARPDGLHDLDALRRAILSTLSTHKLFLAMLSWESEVKGAAVRTFNRIHDLVADPQPNGKAQRDPAFLDILKNLAKAAWGKENARENPGPATTSGLAPLLLDYLDSILENPDYSHTWSEAITGGWNRDLSRDASAHLNAQCLIDLSCRDRRCRGVWLEFTATALRRPIAVWHKFFGKTRWELAEEFINPGADGDADNIRRSVRLGLLECTAACDYANNKAPLRRFILCARIPGDQLRHVIWNDQPSPRYRKHDAIHRIEVIAIDNDEFELFLNFRYVLSLPQNHIQLNQNITEAVFRVRSQALAEIMSAYASHTTRPGKYSFPTREGSGSTGTAPTGAPRCASTRDGSGS